MGARVKARKSLRNAKLARGRKQVCRDNGLGSVQAPECGRGGGAGRRTVPPPFQDASELRCLEATMASTKRVSC